MPKRGDVGMNCPKCRHFISEVRETRSAGSEKMPGELIGLNLNRRLRTCTKCGHTYHTIEMLETDFDNLRKPVNLQRPLQRVRPIG